jgi:hypothetical protein
MFDQLYTDPARLQQFMNAMTGASMSGFYALAEAFDFSKHQTLCDVGGATGQLAVIVARRHSHLRCTTFDLPAVEPLAKDTIEAAGLTDRVTVASGDFFIDPLPAADVITMGMILHDWNLEQKLHLIQAACRTHDRRHRPQGECSMSGQRPHEVIWTLTNAEVASRCLHVVAELGVADAVGDEPVTAVELASACGADADALHRVLCLLTDHGCSDATALGSATRRHRSCCAPTTRCRCGPSHR